MIQIKTKYKGHLYIELMVTITLIGLMLGCLSVSLSAFRQFNHYQLKRQQCISAAQAQLNSIDLTGNELDSKLLNSLWPNVSTAVTTSTGTGQWKGLQLVEVTAHSKSFNKDVSISLSRYMTVKGKSR